MMTFHGKEPNLKGSFLFPGHKFMPIVLAQGNFHECQMLMLGGGGGSA